MMVYGGNGLSYQELREMDMADYREAVEARILYNTEWTKKRGVMHGKYPTMKKWYN